MHCNTCTLTVLDISMVSYIDVTYVYIPKIIYSQTVIISDDHDTFFSYCNILKYYGKDMEASLYYIGSCLIYFYEEKY